MHLQGGALGVLARGGDRFLSASPGSRCISGSVATNGAGRLGGWRSAMPVCNALWVRLLPDRMIALFFA
jgi:hypothetical protein